MNEHNEQQLNEVEESVDLFDQDDRDFGSLFKIPAPPILGQTGWSLN